MNAAVPPPSNAPPAPQPSTPLPPTSTAQAPPVVLTATNAASGTVLQLPPNLNTLPIGLQLEATVSERPSPGQLLLETRSGPLTVQTALTPPVGARLLLQVTFGGAQPAIFLAPQATNAPPLAAGQTSLAQPQSATTLGQPAVTTGATNIDTASPNRPASALPSPASVLTGTSDSNGQIRGSVVQATVIKTSSSNSSAATTGQGVGKTQTGQAALTPGDRLVLRIAAVARPGTSAPPASPGAASMTGTVTGNGLSGQATVRTNAVELSLAVPRPLPAGSNLLLELVGRSVPLPQPITEPRGLALANRWETLHDALRTGGAAPALSAIGQAIPQPGAPMTNALLFFIAALRTGDLRGWLGPDAARAIEREGLLGRMTEEFGIMQRIASEPAGQDWRLFLIPMLSDEQLRQIRLFVRDRGGTGSNAEDPQETRFIIEVTFSRLGPFQFDGLARPKSLDLIIRTELDIARDLRQSITDIFTDTTSALGLDGSVRFRTDPFFELQPLRDAGLANGAGVLA